MRETVLNFPFAEKNFVPFFVIHVLKIDLVRINPTVLITPFPSHLITPRTSASVIHSISGWQLYKWSTYKRTNTVWRCIVFRCDGAPSTTKQFRKVYCRTGSKWRPTPEGKSIHPVVCNILLTKCARHLCFIVCKSNVYWVHVTFMCTSITEYFLSK